MHTVGFLLRKAFFIELFYIYRMPKVEFHYLEVKQYAENYCTILGMVGGGFCTFKVTSSHTTGMFLFHVLSHVSSSWYLSAYEVVVEVEV